MPWSTAKFLAELRRAKEAGYGIVQRKNADYAGGEREQDPFYNFNMVERFSHGRISAEDGMLVRMTDKLARLFNLAENAPEVTDESFSDTCGDLANYADILGLLRRSRTEPDDMATGGAAEPDPAPQPPPAVYDQIRELVGRMLGSKAAPDVQGA